MSCNSTPTPRDFLIKIEKSDHTNDHNVYDDNQKETSTQSVGLFRKYLFSKHQHNLGDTKEDERARVLKRTSSTHPELGHTSRPYSCLEKHIFSEMRSDAMLPPSPPGGNATTSQLAIFFAGIVNVYDNVSTDQAHAIMHLARSSKSAPIVANTQKVDVPKSQHDQRLSLSSLCKLQAADLPLARRNSLRRFMDKRRGRITSKSPYTAATSSCSSRRYVEDDHCGSNGEESLSHSSSLEFIDLSKLIR